MRSWTISWKERFTGFYIGVQITSTFMDGLIAMIEFIKVYTG